MKLTKSKLKLIIKEEMEQMELQDLQPQVDAIYNILQSEMGEASKDSEQLEEAGENNSYGGG